MSEYLTQGGLAKLKRKLDYLKNTERKNIAKRIKSAASFGDLKENAAYHEAKEAQAFLEGKILELKQIIRNVKIIDKKISGKVEIGSVVVVSSDGEEEKFQIVGSEEVDILKGKISYKSPLGISLLGKKKGEKVKIKNPEGDIVYKIIDIS